MEKILLLGSGELGKEFTIAAKRYGQTVIAVDSYANAPAMQVADDFEIINMLDGEALNRIVEQHKPSIIVPEIEAIRTSLFYDFEAKGIQVVPSAKAANFTMDRKKIRDLAAKDLGLKTANYRYATNLEELKKAVAEVGIPCVVKPLMSSSGKGQSTIKSESEIEIAWENANTKGRGDQLEVIVEAFIQFDSEITLLTVTQKSGPTLFCPPIGHRQERGDYQESWQPAHISEEQLKIAQDMAAKVTAELKGAGIWGVEFFLGEEVYFSELSPRPHDTGMVTLGGSQNFNEFELHARAVLGLPIPEITLERHAANAVVLFQKNEVKTPTYSGTEKAANYPKSDFRIFGKPTTRQYRRMGIGIAYDAVGTDVDTLRKKAKEVADQITVD
ncbi:formate-dependent phosphoribosylglycinamide formyltransferase [Acidiluteibacter ferrifornacis]|uniref:Formate-dependent phosphoribosylglycinamide formyltransferase n=1 Tax=Acidiluteibacter ferrifornacis TaxID=2692424 RepID=A0A6N9NM85_9FLAO|nr:formate-dependent phosphoribosylglycinamide formyltransferase [Acidiluteibacter ferrifornacis]NBG66227.1 formate-dependent phosphoribosylglycinamide formyltransferase [Acidiluteibacter ferrifornacis]